MDLLYLVKAKTVVPLATQTAAAEKFGFKPSEAEANSGYAGNRVYLDQRMAGQQLGDWFEELVRAVRKGDVVHLYDLTLFGEKEGMIADKLAAIGAKGASVKLTSSGLLVRPTQDALAVIAAMTGARDAVRKKRAKIMLAAKRKTGNLGGAPFRYTPEERELVREAWLVSRTRAELLLRAEKAIGRPISHTQIFRWSKGQEPNKVSKGWAPWPPMGSGPRPKPIAKRRKRRRAKR